MEPKRVKEQTKQRLSTFKEEDNELNQREGDKEEEEDRCRILVLIGASSSNLPAR